MKGIVLTTLNHILWCCYVDIDIFTYLGVQHIDHTIQYHNRLYQMGPSIAMGWSFIQGTLSRYQSHHTSLHLCMLSPCSADRLLYTPGHASDRNKCLLCNYQCSSIWSLWAEMLEQGPVPSYMVSVCCPGVPIPNQLAPGHSTTMIVLEGIPSGCGSRQLQLWVEDALVVCKTNWWWPRKIWRVGHGSDLCNHAMRQEPDDQLLQWCHDFDPKSWRYQHESREPGALR